MSKNIRRGYGKIQKELTVKQPIGLKESEILGKRSGGKDGNTIVRPKLSGGFDQEFDKVFNDLDEAGKPKMVLNPSVGTEKHWLEADLYCVRFGKDGRVRMREKGKFSPDYQIKNYVGSEIQEQLKESEKKLLSLFYPRLKRYASGGAFQNLAEKMKEAGFKEGDDFANDGNAMSQADGFSTEYIPQMFGDYYKQLYLQDFLSMHAKAFEHWNHSPIAHRIITLLTQYTVGKRIKVTFYGSKKEEMEKIWDDFWKANQMQEVLGKWVQDGHIEGEQIIRKQFTNIGPTVRRISSSTVLEVVTDPEDMLQRFYFHQQFQTRMMVNYGMGTGEPGQKKVEQPKDWNKFIIRQIPAEEVMFKRFNCSTAEARGRTVLYSSLGYLKRSRDILDSLLIKIFGQAQFMADIEVDGDQGMVNAVSASMNRFPRSGAAFTHNKNVQMKPYEAKTGVSGSGDDVMIEMVLSIVAGSVGMPREFLNVAMRGSNRAGALIAGEPFTKVIDESQQSLEDILRDMADWLFNTIHKMNVGEGDYEFMFPSVTKDTVSETFKQVDNMYQSHVISHKRMSEMKAVEKDITSYDYEDEQKQIKKDIEMGLNPDIIDPEANAPDPSSGSSDGGSPSTHPQNGELHGEGKLQSMNQMKSL